MLYFYFRLRKYGVRSNRTIGTNCSLSLPILWLFVQPASTRLIQACKIGYMDKVLQLLKRGYDVNQVDEVRRNSTIVYIKEFRVRVRVYIYCLQKIRTYGYILI